MSSYKTPYDVDPYYQCFSMVSYRFLGAVNYAFLLMIDVFLPFIIVATIGYEENCINRRPNTSAKGARAIGLNAKASTKIETTMLASLSLMLGSPPILLKAGASIDALISVTMPPIEHKRVIAHRLARDQLKGQSGLSGPDNPTLLAAHNCTHRTRSIFMGSH